LLLLQKSDENYEEALAIDTSGYAVALTYQDFTTDRIWIRTADDLQLAMKERQNLTIFAAVREREPRAPKADNSAQTHSPTHATLTPNPTTEDNRQLDQLEKKMELIEKTMESIEKTMELIVGIVTAMHKQMPEKHLPIDPELLAVASIPTPVSSLATLPVPTLNSSLVLESIEALEQVGPEAAAESELADLEPVAAPELAVPDTAATKTVPELPPAEWMIVSSSTP